MTRYEMAVIINRAVNAVESKMAAGEAVKPSDLAALRRLVDEFGNELKAVQNQVAALNRRVDSLGRTVAADTNQLRMAKPGFIFVNRPGEFTQNVSAVAGPTGATANAELPAGTVVAFGGGHGSPTNQTAPVGLTARGTDYQIARLALTGALTKEINYGFRVETVMEPVNPASGLSVSAPSYCTAPTANGCNLGDYSANMPLRLNFAYIGYNSPGGVFLQAGRFVMDSGRYNESGFIYGGQYNNGLKLGYSKDNIYAWIAGVANNSAATNMAIFGPTFNRSTVGFEGHADYYLPQPQLDLGGSYVSMSGDVQNQWNPYAGLCNTAPGSAAGATTVANAFTVPCPAGTTLVRVTAPLPGQVLGAPITGAYQNVQQTMSAGSIFAVKLFGNHARPQFKVVAEGEQRFGNDPFTGQQYAGNKSFYGELAFASKGNLEGGPLIAAPGIAGSNVVQLNYYNIGLNGTGPEGGPYGVLPWQSWYYGGSQNGFQNWQLHLDRWITNNFRVGIGFEHWNLQSGITIPAGSNTCPGCYVNGVNSNAVFLDTYMTL